MISLNEESTYYNDLAHYVKKDASYEYKRYRGTGTAWIDSIKRDIPSTSVFW